MRRYLVMRMVFAFVAMTSVAVAEPVGDGLEVVAVKAKNTILVRRAKQQAELVRGTGFVAFKVDKATRTVVADVEDQTCVGHTKHTWTLGHLDARLANAEGYALYLKKDLKGAAGHFQRAVASDPTWNIPAYNLASARQLLGDKSGAVAVLAPWLAKDPIVTYQQVSLDPELSPLLDRPELAKRRSAAPGNAKVTEKGLDSPLYLKDRDLIAVARSEGSGGGAQYTIDIQVWNAKTGALVASTTLVNVNDTRGDYPGGLTTAGKKAVAERAPRIQRMLVELGFKPTKIEEGTIKEHDTAAKMMAYFAKAKLGVVATPDVANALRGNTQVGSVKSSGKMMSATYFEEASAIVIKNQLHAIEAGCDAGPEIGHFVIPVK